MAATMLASLTALVLLAPHQAPPPSSPESLEELLARSQAEYAALERVVYEDVLILDRGDNSGTPSCGIFSWNIAIKGRLLSGETTYFYQTWCSAGQAAPPVSGHCRLAVVIRPRWDGFVSGENDLPPPDAPWSVWMAFKHKHIERFDCTISSDSPTIPPGDGEPMGEWSTRGR